jgi:hypothetical protein
VPEKLERCVRDVKAQGKSKDSAWAICVDSTGEKPHKESSTNLPFFKKKTQEKDYPWGQCISDQKKDGSSDESAKKICGSIKAKYGETTKGKIREKVNENRQVPFFNPPTKVDSNKPDNRKTTKGIGGPRLDMDSFLWKDIFDAQLRRNVKEPRI